MCNFTTQSNKVLAKIFKLFLLISLTFLINLPQTLHVIEADETGQTSINVKSSSIVSEFPKGIWLNLEAVSDAKITEITSRLKIGQTKGTTYNYLCSDELNKDSETWRCKDLVPNKNNFWSGLI